MADPHTDAGKTGTPHTPLGLLVTDLDGTLLRSDKTLAPTDRDTLVRLEALRIVRVIATGRSLYSFRQTALPDLPIDYLIFSGGAGIMAYPSGIMLRKIDLAPDAVHRTIGLLVKWNLDFMVHRPIPDSHHFAYHSAGGHNPDFRRRLALYKPFCRPLDGGREAFGPATQLLVVVPPDGSIALVDRLRSRLPGVNVIRTTSPIDGRSVWIEIFSPRVSKYRAARWLARRMDLDRRDVCAVGNDYNDLDLLEWPDSAFVVANAPADIRARFAAVDSNDHCGVSDAVSQWLAARQ